MNKKLITMALTCLMIIGCVMPVWAGAKSGKGGAARPGSPEDRIYGIPVDIGNDGEISAESARRAMEAARRDRMEDCLNEANSVPDELDAGAARDAIEEARRDRMQEAMNENEGSSNETSPEDGSYQIAEEFVHLPSDDNGKIISSSPGDGTGRKPKGK